MSISVANNIAIWAIHPCILREPLPGEHLSQHQTRHTIDRRAYKILIAVHSAIQLLEPAANTISCGDILEMGGGAIANLNG